MVTMGQTKCRGDTTGHLEKKAEEEVTLWRYDVETRKQEMRFLSDSNVTGVVQASWYSNKSKLKGAIYAVHVRLKAGFQGFATHYEVGSQGKSLEDAQRLIN